MFSKGARDLLVRNSVVYLKKLMDGTNKFKCFTLLTVSRTQPSRLSPSVCVDIKRLAPPLDFLVIRTVNWTERVGFYFYSDTITVSSCICPRLIPFANCLMSLEIRSQSINPLSATG